MAAEKPIKLGNYEIGPGNPPFIVAEMSGNHNQSLDRALEIVEAAARAGAHALKIQTYTADTLTLDVEDDEFLIKEPDSLWHGQSLYQLYSQAFTPWEWHERIFRRCQELGIIGFSTPFDLTAIDFLESLDVPAYKIASFENADTRLIEKAAATGKPIFISTGMATVGELEETVQKVRSVGNENIVLLKCTSSYPASPRNTNLHTLPHMRQLFDTQVGLSDHTLGIGVAVAAVVLGATVIEKHFTLRRADGGVDAAFSLEPAELTALVEETKRAWEALGSVHYGPTETEKKSLRFRRSLYVAKDMKAGEKFTPENLKSVRPGFGISPKYYDLLLGKRVNRDLKRGTAVSWDFIG